MAKPQPNVIVLLVDALRADHLSCYGYPHRTSPFIDQLAQGGTRFQCAIAPAPWTLPVHASLFTGRYPSEHNATFRHLRLEATLPTLAELLASAGYYTAGFSNNAWVGRDSGLDRGFHEFEEIQPYVIGDTLSRRYKRFFDKLAARLLHLGFQRGRRAERTLRKVVLWIESHLAQREEQPFFIFINLMDVHDPYMPPVQFLKPFLPGGIQPGEAYELEQNADLYNVGITPLTGHSMQVLSALYDGEIAYVDDQLGRFCRRLDRLGLLETMALIVTSDHGENLGDHGLVGHQYCLYDSLLHVPLILHWPSQFPAGQVVRTQVPLLNLFDTILDIGSAAWPLAPSGRPLSLLNVIKTPLHFERIFAEYQKPTRLIERLRRQIPEFDNPKMLSAQRCLRTERYKLIQWERAGQELFELALDPGELRNMAHGKEGRLVHLETELLEWASSMASATLETTESAEEAVQAMDERVLARLRALGYLA